MELITSIFENSFFGSSLPGLILLLSAGLTAIVSLILLFHWRRYGMGGPALAITELIYLGVAAGLITAAFLSM